MQHCGVARRRAPSTAPESIIFGSIMFREQIRNSLYERARFFLQKVSVERLLRKNNLQGPWLWSADLLQTLLSIKSLLPRIPDVLVDVGANRGEFSAAADRVLGFKHIVCVEPDLDLIPELNANLPTSKCNVHPVALSSNDSRSVLFIHEDRSMNSLIEADPAILREKFPTYCSETVATRDVPTTTLDSLVRHAALLDGHSLFLKLDTQGNELDILHAGTNTLSRSVACLVEFMFCTPYATRYSFRDLIEFFDERGFECRGALEVKRRPSHEISGVDFLFVKTA